MCGAAELRPFRRAGRPTAAGRLVLIGLIVQRMLADYSAAVAFVTSFATARVVADVGPAITSRTDPSWSMP